MGMRMNGMGMRMIGMGMRIKKWYWNEDESSMGMKAWYGNEGGNDREMMELQKGILVNMRKLQQEGCTLEHTEQIQLADLHC